AARDGARARAASLDPAPAHLAGRRGERMGGDRLHAAARAPARSGPLSAARLPVVALVAIMFVGAMASPARAQGDQPEARIDAFVAHRSALQAAVGADIPFSPELHLELVAGAGPAFGGGPGVSFSARGDAVVHF